MNILIIIDMLNDFAKEGGALYVKGAETLIPRIKKCIDSKPDFVLYMCDSHPNDSKEFEKWPKHCISGTPGALIVDELKPNKEWPKVPTIIFEKDEIACINAKDETGNKFSDFLASLLKNGEYVSYIPGNELKGVPYSTDKSFSITFCGVATEYCVLAAIRSTFFFVTENAYYIPEMNILTDCIAGVDIKYGDVNKALVEIGQWADPITSEEYCEFKD
jgi:nicotinamidase-related amidase